MFIYAIKDVKATEFIQIFKQKNDEMALRDVSNVCNDPRNLLMFTSPQDFELYRLCEFDSETGTILSTFPEFIKNFMELKDNDKK